MNVIIVFIFGDFGREINTYLPIVGTFRFPTLLINLVGCYLFTPAKIVKKYT